MRQLDPEAQSLLDVMAATGSPQPYTLPVEQAREQMRSALITRGAPLALLETRDLTVPTAHGGLPLRLYRPAQGQLPIALFIHGGGWTLNDIDTHDRLARRIAGRSGWLLASLEYRRAPEHRHPAALEDAYLAYRWLLDNAALLGADPSCSAIVGESSGASTAAALTLLARDLGAPSPSLQVLAYPLTDVPGRWPSYRERGEGYTLDRRYIEWFMEQCLPAGYAEARSFEEHPDPYLFPLNASDLSSLPPAFVMTAEFDPLRDEGIAYAERLVAAGNVVQHVHVADQMHGFLLLDRAITRAGQLIDQLADALAAYARGTRSQSG